MPKKNNSDDNKIKLFILFISGILLISVRETANFIRIKMEEAAVLNNSGIALTEANRPFEAIGLFRQALVLEPENPLLWLNLGIAQQKTGEYPDAIESFQKSLLIDDGLTEAWHSMGLIYYELNELDVARQCYLSAIKNCDNDPKIWNNLGVVYFNQSNYEEARSCFEKSISLSPQYFDALYNLRDTCRELCDWRAAAEFERVISELGANKERSP
ncbi:MAG: tetratricopeptide repeat protein [Treponema sp.]|jgi:tetratricopeptide (TPR) repeat protein|nr:tetratricopeptide repeat protein [Treponema sp.]